MTGGAVINPLAALMGIFSIPEDESLRIVNIRL
jgi:hypothetical protein